MLGTIVVSYQQTVWEYLNAPRWNSGGCGAGIQDSFPSQDRRLDQISQKPRQVTCKWMLRTSQDVTDWCLLVVHAISVFQVEAEGRADRDQIGDGSLDVSGGTAVVGRAVVLKFRK